MARYTKAYSAFVWRMNEVEILRRQAASNEKRDAIGLRDEINALCRGSIVLLSSHLEAFIKELGEVALDSMHANGIQRTRLRSRLYYHISRDILDEVQDTSDPEKIGEKIFSFLQTDLSYWSRTGPFPEPIPVDRFNKGFSNPAFKKVKKYFNRFGYETYNRDLVEQLQGAYHPTVNMVDHLVDTRNKIAHGDSGATKTPSDVSAMIATTRLFCRSTDSTFGSWWKSHFCAIR
jgi:hypothetical protein